MYSFLLYTHSWLRWIVLILAVLCIVQSLIGWKQEKPFNKLDNIISASFMGTIHLMVLIGLALYFISPLAFQAFGGEANVMKVASLRFWAVEHIFMGLVGTALITIGRVKSKKQSEDKLRFKTQFIFYTLGLIVILSRIPWSESNRLFRW